MLRHLAVAALLIAQPLAAPAAAPDGASEADRLIFADRDWSGAKQGLSWTLERVGPPAEGFVPVEDGRLRLVEVTDEKHKLPMLEMHEVAGGRDRVVGSFPTSVDPLVIYFFENASRNMAALTGGSPIYIRNRIKAALRSGGAVTTGADGTKTVVLTPFSDDPNAGRMRGFEALTLTITLAPEDGAPIRGMRAEAPAAGYRLTLAGVQP